MNQPVAFLGTPHMGFFSLLIIGGLAGWIASMATKSNHGVFTNILIGICGSFLGVNVVEALGYVVQGTLGHLVAAAVGSVVIIIAWRLLHPAQRNLVAS